MKKQITYRLSIIGVLVFISIICFIPTLLSDSSRESWKEWMPDTGLKLGLDLQGGTHLVFEVDVDKAIQTRLERMVDEIKENLKEDKYQEDTLSVKNNKIILSPVDEKIKNTIEETFEGIITVSKATSDSIEYKLTAQQTRNIKDLAADQALETIRNRVDQFGVAEPSIHRQGEREIVVQLPGVKDPKRAIDLIGKTALLQFRIVDEESPVAAELPLSINPGEEKKVLKKFAEKIPEDTIILFERKVNKETGRVTKHPYLLKKKVLMTGDLLVEARKGIDRSYNEAIVTIKFNKAGTKLFEKITAENVKKRLAIILDDNVYSAPVIQERIPGGEARITGRFTDQEARDLAIVLRAGALPAPLKMIQNVTVGPSLGSDSINAGIKAGIVSAILVIGFMVIYYKVAGLIADFALVLNIILLLGVLAAFNATLTLPGIAGIILAIGLAVDTNVLMFERMREELRAGKTPKASVDAGYDKAFWTIVDSHVTTIITAVVLFQFGTGPIKGFAVTLGFGVGINLITALFGTKSVFDLLNLRREVKTLSI
jgi:preprotein translocase subunit SecD